VVLNVKFNLPKIATYQKYVQKPSECVFLASSLVSSSTHNYEDLSHFFSVALNHARFIIMYFCLRRFVSQMCLILVKLAGVRTAVYMIIQFGILISSDACALC
jgi:hypothetical protein